MFKSNPRIEFNFDCLIFSATTSPGSECPKFTIVVCSKQTENQSEIFWLMSQQSTSKSVNFYQFSSAVFQESSIGYCDSIRVVICGA